MPPVVLLVIVLFHLENCAELESEQYGNSSEKHAHFHVQGHGRSSLATPTRNKRAIPFSYGSMSSSLQC